MVKLTHIIRRQFANELFDVFYRFVGLTLKGLRRPSRVWKWIYQIFLELIFTQTVSKCWLVKQICKALNLRCLVTGFLLLPGISYVFPFLYQWPFVRVFGLQEPASVLFSSMNLMAVLFGWRKYEQCISRSYALYGLTQMQAVVSSS